MNEEKFLAGDCIDLRQRTEFAESVQRLLQKRRGEALAVRDAFYQSQSRESLRKDFIDMLGWPLNDWSLNDWSLNDWSLNDWSLNDPGACRGAVNCRREALRTDGDFIMERLQLEVLPDFWFYGILFKPLTFSPKKKYALVIAQHGGGGSPEIVGGILPQQPDGGNYNNMVRRLKRDDTLIFAPQLLMWYPEFYGECPDRVPIDYEFKQTGGSITALETFCICRAIDYFCAPPDKNAVIDPDRIGMAGLSYGGMYALYTAAVDTRIRSTLSSCFFNDRFAYNRTDWTYFKQAHTFFDAETAALVYPRALYIEVADKDEAFAPDGARREAERLSELLKTEKEPPRFQFKVFSGVHEFDKGDDGIQWFYTHLFEGKE